MFLFNRLVLRVLYFWNLKSPICYCMKSVKFSHTIFILSFVCALVSSVTGQTSARRVRVAALDFGSTETGRRASEKLSTALASETKLSLVDRALSRDAARGAGYAGSLNMTLDAARDLGAAVGCDFYVAGHAVTVRRVPFTGPIFYEAYLSIFIVSARTGRLAAWDRLSFEAPLPEAAEKLLLAELHARAARYAVAMLRAEEDERNERAQSSGHRAPAIEELPEEGARAALNFRPPQPYRRLRPLYTDAAARAGAEATVDVQVDIGADGEVTRAEVLRWAGYGLDEAAVNTVRQLHFRPAMRDGAPVPVRVVLRYNFRRPPR